MPLTASNDKWRTYQYEEVIPNDACTIHKKEKWHHWNQISEKMLHWDRVSDGCRKWKAVPTAIHMCWSENKCTNTKQYESLHMKQKVQLKYINTIKPKIMKLLETRKKKKIHFRQISIIAGIIVWYSFRWDHEILLFKTGIHYR